MLQLLGSGGSVASVKSAVPLPTIMKFALLLLGGGTSIQSCCWSSGDEGWQQRSTHLQYHTQQRCALIPKQCRQKQVQAKGCPALWHDKWHLLLLAVATAAGERDMCNQTPFFVGFMDTGLTFRLSSIVWLQHSNSAAQGLQEFCCQCHSCCFSNIAWL